MIAVYLWCECSWSFNRLLRHPWKKERGAVLFFCPEYHTFFFRRIYFQEPLMATDSVSPEVLGRRELNPCVIKVIHTVCPVRPVIHTYSLSSHKYILRALSLEAKTVYHTGLTVCMTLITQELCFLPLTNHFVNVHFQAQNGNKFSLQSYLE
jgi:hypothetical protein